MEIVEVKRGDMVWYVCAEGDLRFVCVCVCLLVIVEVVD